MRASKLTTVDHAITSDPESLSQLVTSLRGRVSALEAEQHSLIEQRSKLLKDKKSQQTALDISETKSADLEVRCRSLNELGKSYSELFDLAPFAYMVLDAAGVVSKVNLAATCLMQLPSSRLINSLFSDFLNDSDQNKLSGYLNAAATSLLPEKWLVDLKIGCGEPVSVMLANNAINNSQTGEYSYQLMIIDVSEHVKNERLLRNANSYLTDLAHHDPLTELPNRMLFRDNLDSLVNQRIRDKGRIGLIYFDLDGFKPINDTFGHAAGDKVLKTIARRISGLLRPGDTISRLGGDEFTVIMDLPANAGEAMDYAQMIKTAIKEPFKFEDTSVSIGSSVGICLYPDHARHIDDLVKGADAAMYKAKQAGRDQIMMFTDESLETASRLSTLESSLSTAIENRQLQLHYQPIYDSKSLAIVSVEALVRWQHPVLGTVSPGEFIPLAEKTRQIIGIGEWVLEQACKQARVWRQSGINVPVSINVSSKELIDPDFAVSVRETLARHGLAVNAIEIEITETSVIFDYDQCIKTLQQLKDNGMVITIDDFGAGYSSLGRLAQLPVSKLKIDRMFINDISRCENVRSITHSLIKMAHELDLYVISEGIENHEQLEFLVKHNSDAIQGFMMSRAEPSFKITELLKDNLEPAQQNCLA